MNTLERNKLIAEFMGYKFYNHLPVKRNGWQLPNQSDTAIYLAYSDEDLQYHTSWDWLMPVVNKCLNIYHIEQMNDDLNFTFYNAMGNMEETYHAVVEFIQLYNENKK